MTNAQRAQAVTQIILAVIETIRECKRAPRGALYAGLMAKGCRLDQFEMIERIMLQTGKVRRQGDELVWVDNNTWAPLPIDTTTIGIND